MKATREDKKWRVSNCKKSYMAAHNTLVDLHNIVIDEIFDDHEAQLKAERKKARSIVAMLFWKARKRKRFCTSRFKDDYKIAERLFRQAYAMLKDNQ